MLVFQAMNENENNGSGKEVHVEKIFHENGILVRKLFFHSEFLLPEFPAPHHQ